MSSKNITYPQYRKYSNNTAYFKIISDSKFEEIQLLGKNITLHVFKAKILPDRNYIHDLSFDYKKYWEICSAEEFEKLKGLAKPSDFL